MRIELQQTLLSPVAQCFAFLSEPRNRPLWQRSLDRVEMLTEGPPGKGTRWREWPPLLGEVQMEITSYETDKIWAEQGVSRFGRLDLQLQFEPIDSNTRLLVQADIEPPAGFHWAAAMARGLITREIRNDVGRAAKLIAVSPPTETQR